MRRIETDKRSWAVIDGRETRVVGGVLSLSAAILLLHWDAVVALVSHWPHSNFRHCLLVPLISGYLLWDDRSKLRGVVVEPSWWGLGLLLLATWAWVVGRLSGIAAIEHLSLVALIWSAVMAIFGIGVQRTTGFALAYLVFAVPLGEQLAGPLMSVTADLADWLLGIAGVASYRVNQVFVLPNGTFEVAEVCSGLNYLTAGLALATLLAFLQLRSIVARIGFVAVAAALVILANGLRAALTMAIASWSEMKLLMGLDHIALGWIIFSITMISLYVATMVVSRRTHEASR